MRHRERRASSSALSRLDVRHDGALAVVPFAEGYDPPAAVGETSGWPGSRAWTRIEASSSLRSPTTARPSWNSSATLRTSFDDLVDRAPSGQVEVAGGVFKHTYRGN